MIKKCIIVIVFVIGFLSPVSGQIERNKNSIFRVDRTELGLGAGTTFYLGDYNPYMPFIEPRYYGTVLHRFYFDLLYALRTSISFGNIAGNSSNFTGYMPYYSEKFGSYGNKNKYTLHFNRTFIDFNTGVELGFRPLDPVVHRMNERFSPYLFLGVGITILYHNNYPNDDASRDARMASMRYPRVYNSENHSGTIQAFNIPVGIGFKYSPWKRWTVGGEWQFKKTFSDDIDHFNNINATEKELNAKKGTVLLNTDWISFFGVSISYRLAVTNKCPSVKRTSPSRRFFQGINRDYDIYDNNSGKKKKKSKK
jgi:hypothetical protein